MPANKHLKGVRSGNKGNLNIRSKGWEDMVKSRRIAARTVIKIHGEKHHKKGI